MKAFWMAAGALGRRSKKGGLLPVLGGSGLDTHSTSAARMAASSAARVSGGTAGWVGRVGVLQAVASAASRSLVCIEQRRRGPGRQGR